MSDSSGVIAAARQLDQAAPEDAHSHEKAVPKYGEVVNRHPTYLVQYDEHGHPQTLLDWRMAPLEVWQTGRKLWDPLDDFFDSRGYSLFVARPSHNCHYGPKAIDEIRTPDAYHHVLNDGRKVRCSFYPGYLTNKLIPATRKSDGAHVMVQLVCKGDQGSSELDILRYFSQPELRQCPENHGLPILDELEYQDMKFVVLPLLFEGLVQPWYQTVDEALEAVRQTFEITDPKQYGKWLTDNDYCPFKSDVYQLGLMWMRTLVTELDEFEPLDALLLDMTNKDAAARPNMGTAVDRLRTFLAALTESQMSRCAKDLEKPSF